MLEKYKEIYPNLYKIINNELNNNCLNHAYIIETSENKEEIAKDIVKAIILYGKDKKVEDSKNIEFLIDINNYPDLKIIDAEGQWIKKEQILEIQSEFKNKSIFGNKRIYVIKSAEKLNKSSANTMLKFLEEPNEDIIAILMTNNIYSVIKTISSRCQCIKLQNKINVDISEEQKKIIYNFVNIIEKYKTKAIAHISEIPEILEFDRNELAELFQNIIYFYEEVLNSILEINFKYYKDEEALKIIQKVKDKNNILSITKKIKSLDYSIEKIRYNINIKLLLDKLIITMNK